MRTSIEFYRQKKGVTFGIRREKSVFSLTFAARDSIWYLVRSKEVREKLPRGMVCGIMRWRIKGFEIHRPRRTT